MNYLNVIDQPKINLESVDRLLVIDNTDNIKSLDKNDLSYPTCIFDLEDLTASKQRAEVFQAIKAGKPFNAYLKAITSKVVTTCEYLLPVGLDASKTPIIIRFEHIHYRAVNGANLPQQLESFEVKLNSDGSFEYIDNSSLLTQPVIYLSDDKVQLSNQLTARQVAAYIQAGNPITVSYRTEDKTVCFTSFEMLNDTDFKCFGIDGEYIYTANVYLTLLNYTITTNAIHN